MATRTIIHIDEEKCDGCGLCAQGCPEGALQIIEGKARMVGDSLCDGLGACIGECPRGAITTIEREAIPYDEEQVIENIIPKGKATILAHLDHLYSHGQDTWYHQALQSLKKRAIVYPEGELPHFRNKMTGGCQGGCPGTMSRSFEHKTNAKASSSRSALAQWPIQLHLINPRAPYFYESDLLIAADCTAFACGAFHQQLLEGRKVVIACPKLDDSRQVYIDKLRTLINESHVRSITLAIMEVPCCSGLRLLVDEAMKGSTQDISISTVVVGIEKGSLTWM